MHACMVNAHAIVVILLVSDGDILGVGLGGFPTILVVSARINSSIIIIDVIQLTASSCLFMLW